jgi:type VI secretion system secreted protein VgrG
MSQHPLEYRIEVQRWAFHVREIRGTEALSRPFRLELGFFLDHQSMQGDPASFDPDEVIKQPATIVMSRGPDEVRRIEGVVTRASLSAAIRGVPEVRMVVEPRLALARWREDIRVHREQTVPEIVRDVVRALGVQIEWRLRDGYARRPYSVQYRETDLDYVSRLLEDEGIFYFFAPGDVMVLGDAPGAYQPVAGDPAIPLRSAAGATENEDAVHEIGSRAALTAGRVTLRDWCTERPDLDMDVGHDTAIRTATEWYDYPGEYEDPAAGRRKARLHAEAFDRGAAALCGASTVGRLFPGATFRLLDAEHVPELAGAAGGELVVRKVEHDWHRGEVGFAVRFEADGAGVTYRPARETYVPRSFNPVTGIVCTNGEDIQCDHFGRVKVHFHWDRLRPYDDDCSHWVPVLQDNTGGSSAIPRRGWEVLVHYLEGDPDRPIVLGRVYNGADPMQEPLPATKTRSSLRSLTTPTRDGSNEIMLDDKAGSQLISVHAEKDQLIRIANDRTEQTNADQESSVGHDETVSIGNDARWSVGRARSLSVGGSQKWSVGGDSERRVECSDSSTCKGNRETQIGGNHERKVFADDGVSAKKLTEQIGGAVTETFQGKHTRRFGKQCEIAVGGSLMETAKETKTESTTGARQEQVSGMHLLRAAGEVRLRVTANRTTTVGGAVLARAQKELTLTGAEKLKCHAPSLALAGAADVTLKVGDTVVLMKDGIIRIDAPQQIGLVTDQANQQGAGKAKQI